MSCVVNSAQLLTNRYKVFKDSALFECKNRVLYPIWAFNVVSGGILSIFDRNGSSRSCGMLLEKTFAMNNKVCWP